MTQIKKVKTSEGVQFYPITHTKAVIDDNGYTAESRLGAMQDEINQAQLAIGAVPSDLAPTEDSTNWVTSGGVYSAISEIRNAIKTIISSLGNYAFINGKPSFPWMGDLRIINTLSHVISSNYREYINTGESYNTTLKGSGMYAVDDSSVVVTMGGTDITSSAYNTSTHIISISNVTGDITITASGMTYISSGLMLHLDGIQQGATDGVWTDLVRGVVWTPTGATKLPNGWYFDGQSYMLDDGTLGSFDAESTTVEVCLNSELSHATTYFLFVDSDAKTVFCYVDNFRNRGVYITRGVIVNEGPYGCIDCGATSSGDYGYGKRIISYNAGVSGTTSGYLNGRELKAIDCNYSAAATAVIGKRFSASATKPNEFPFKGTLHSLRIYNRKLTLAEMLQNQKIDNMRFNMGFNI